jgi:hypothetical protein
MMESSKFHSLLTFYMENYFRGLSIRKNRVTWEKTLQYVFNQSEPLRPLETKLYVDVAVSKSSNASAIERSAEMVMAHLWERPPS